MDLPTPDLFSPRGRVVAQIGLGEHDHGLGAALGREDQRPLDTTQVEVAVETAREKERVGVGGHHLLFRRGPGGLSRELAAARQHGVDRGAPLGRTRVNRDPIARDRQLGAAARAVPEPSRQLRP